MSAATAYQRLLDALGEHGSTVRANGVSAVAQCPAHDDHNPSLSLRAIEGSVLTHCHAGCHVDDVLATLNLAKSDLYDEPAGTRYDYTDLAGTVLRTVHRSPEKVFRQSGQTKGTAPLYRLPSVVQAVIDGVPVYVTEGEADVHALESLGAVATTSPMGASSAGRADWSPLHGAHVVLVPDRDEAGKRYARDVLEQLDGKAASTRIALPKVGKDAADHVASGHGLDELEATELPAADGAGEKSAGRPRLRLKHAHEAVLRRVRYLWDGRIPLGACTVLPGEEGIGKSTVMARLAADITRGRLPGDLHGQPRHVLIIAAEDHFEAVVVPRLREAGADLSLVSCVDAAVALGGIDRPVVIPRDLPLVAETVAEYGTALVWIDSLVTTLPDDAKATSYKDVATILRALGAFAETADVAVAAPWHLNKSGGSDTALRMMDSRAFRTATRSVLLMVADPEKPGEGVLALDKANAGTLAIPAIRYRLRGARYTVTEIDEATGEVRHIATSCGVADWAGNEAGDGRQYARDLLAPAMDRADDPKVWLRGYLLDAGETPRQTVIAAGADVDFGAKQLQRAARTLRVVYREQVTERPGSTPLKHSTWRLPDPAGEDTSRANTPPTVPTVLPARAGAPPVSSSSQVRDGEDGEDGHARVREGVPTDGQGVLTAIAVCSHGVEHGDQPDPFVGGSASREQPSTDSSKRCTCSTC